MFGAAAVLKFGVVYFLSLLAFLATLTREVVKDIEDIKGDVDRISLPKKIGIKNAGIVGGIILIIAVILSPIPAYPEILPFLEFTKLGYDYLYLIIIADALFIFSIVIFLRNTPLASQTLKAGMATALAAFVLGSIGL
jgi:geranylgeranylglycerol-phosphate geranylgeranyltransferase